MASFKEYLNSVKFNEENSGKKEVFNKEEAVKMVKNY